MHKRYNESETWDSSSGWIIVQCTFLLKGMMCYQMTKEWTVLFQWDQHHCQYDEASAMYTKKNSKKSMRYSNCQRNMNKTNIQIFGIQARDKLSNLWFYCLIELILNSMLIILFKWSLWCYNVDQNGIGSNKESF